MSTRKESNYSPTRGTQNHHCGPDAKWPHGFCEMYRKHNKCSAVAGFIATKGGCDWFKRATHRAAGGRAEGGPPDDDDVSFARDYATSHGLDYQPLTKTRGEYASEIPGKVAESLLPLSAQGPSEQTRREFRNWQEDQLKKTGYAPFAPWEHGANPVLGAAELGTMLPLGAMGVGAKAAVAGAGKLLPAIFAGPMAKTADLAALKSAQEMLAKGATAHDIWNATGWFQGADSKWRFEIPDDQAQLMKHAKDVEKSVPLSEAYRHPDLYAAYPEHAGTRFAATTQYRPGEGALAEFTKEGVTKPLILSGHDPSRVTASDLGALGVIPHESQHYVQNTENFARGASPFFGHTRQDVEMAARKAYEAEIAHADEDDALLRELVPDWKTSQWAIDKKPWDQLTAREKLGWYDRGRSWLYRNSAGEAEARNVQTRMNFTPEQRRAKPPWETEDVPREQQIVRFGTGTQQSANVGPMRSFNSLDELSDHWTDRGVRNNIYEHQRSGEIRLSDLVVPKDQRGQGLGSEFMRDLTAHADAKGQTITLTAARDYGTTSLPRLKNFYKQFGFVENKGRNKDFRISDSMYRRPGGS